jgi:hypothetical protein
MKEGPHTTTIVLGSLTYVVWKDPEEPGIWRGTIKWSTGAAPYTPIKFKKWDGRWKHACTSNPVRYWTPTREDLAAHLERLAYPEDRAKSRFPKVRITKEEK